MQLKVNHRLLQLMVVLDLLYYSISPLLVWYSQQWVLKKSFTPYSSLYVMLLYVKPIKVEKNVHWFNYKQTIINVVHGAVIFTILYHFSLVGMVFTTIEF